MDVKVASFTGGVTLQKDSIIHPIPFQRYIIQPWLPHLQQVQSSGGGKKGSSFSYLFIFLFTFFFLDVKVASFAGGVTLQKDLIIRPIPFQECII